MSRYILNRQFRLRGWHGLPYGIYDMKKNAALFVDQSCYEVIMKCDAEQEIDPDSLSERQREFLVTRSGTGFLFERREKSDRREVQ